jgi:nucleotide-binding universal stress UspA family protein
MTYGFPRMLVVHDSQRLEVNLLQYAALLASREPEPSVMIAASPADTIQQPRLPWPPWAEAAAPMTGPNGDIPFSGEPSLASGARRVFATGGVSEISVRLLPEPDLEAVFDAAREHAADLIVVHHPRTHTRGRALARRLMAESPCSVCFVPDAAAPRLDRVVAGVEASPDGAALLERMAHVCDTWGADELFAVNVAFRETLAGGSEIDERFQQESMLGLYRFMARVPLNGTNCTPVLEEHGRFDRALLKAAAEHNAAMVVVGRSTSHSWLTGPAPSEELLWDCPVPLLQVGAGKVSLLDSVKKRLRTAPEPPFN